MITRGLEQINFKNIILTYNKDLVIINTQKIGSTFIKEIEKQNDGFTHVVVDKNQSFLKEVNPKGSEFFSNLAKIKRIDNKDIFSFYDMGGNSLKESFVDNTTELEIRKLLTQDTGRRILILYRNPIKKTLTGIVSDAVYDNLDNYNILRDSTDKEDFFYKFAVNQFKSNIINKGHTRLWMDTVRELMLHFEILNIKNLHLYNIDDNSISLMETLRKFIPNLKVIKPNKINSNKKVYSSIRKGTLRMNELYDKIEEYLKEDISLYHTIKKSKLNIVTSDIKTII